MKNIFSVAVFALLAILMNYGIVTFLLFTLCLVTFGVGVMAFCVGVMAHDNPYGDKNEQMTIHATITTIGFIPFVISVLLLIYF